MSEQRGIGGWLILPLVGLILSVVWLSLDQVRAYNGVTPELWAFLTDPTQPDYHPLCAPSLVFNVATSALLLVYTLVVLVLFLRKSRRTPPLMIAWLIARAAVILVDAMFVSLIDGRGPFQIGFLVPQLLIAGLWFVYFRSSERVKNTFVR